MQDYYIYWQVDGNEGFKKVEGEKIHVPGFEEFDFFVHRQHDYPKLWKASEGVSGASMIFPSVNTKKEAIQKITDKLSRHTKQEVLNLMIEAISKFGISPRYLDKCLPKIK